MEAAAPIIYVRSDEPARCPAWVRLLAFVIAAGCLAVLLVAAHLHPSHKGFATHRELGLAECQFLQRTGLPCPGCGMTTSFAWFVRGNLAASFYVQPMGCLLAALCCAAVWVGLYIAMSGRPVYRLMRVIPSPYWAVPLLSLAVAAWAWKIAIHLTGRDGW